VTTLPPAVLPIFGEEAGSRGYKCASSLASYERQVISLLTADGKIEEKLVEDVTTKTPSTRKRLAKPPSCLKNGREER
jgi:hypothetical protein